MHCMHLYVYCSCQSHRGALRLLRVRLRLRRAQTWRMSEGHGEAAGTVLCIVGATYRWLQRQCHQPHHQYYYIVQVICGRLATLFAPFLLPGRKGQTSSPSRLATPYWASTACTRLCGGHHARGAVDRLPGVAYTIAFLRRMRGRVTAAGKDSSKHTGLGWEGMAGSQVLRFCVCVSNARRGGP